MQKTEWSWGPSMQSNLRIADEGLVITIGDDYYSGEIPPAEARELGLALLHRWPLPPGEKEPDRVQLLKELAVNMRKVLSPAELEALAWEFQNA